LDGEASLVRDELTLTSLEAKFKQGTASASGTVRKVGSAKPVPDLALRFAADLPAFKMSEVTDSLPILPKDYTAPAMRVEGGAKLRGEDLVLDKVVIKGKGGFVKLDGTVAKALSGEPAPDVEIQANLDLDPLTDKDLPVPGVPPGLELPASRWEADVSYTPRTIRLRKLDVKIGSNELSVVGGISDPAGRGAFDLNIVAKRFVLAELTRLTPRTRDLKLSGSGVFQVAVTGTKDKPMYAGALQFRNVGATIAELPLSDFSGRVKVDDLSINIPNLKGKVDDGELTMFVTITDYTKIPKIELSAELDRFDLGKFLSAQKKLQKDAQTAKAAKAERTGKPIETKPARPLRTNGEVKIGALIHPNAQVRKFAATWDLWGVTPDMKTLNGSARIDVDGGELRAVGDMALQSPVAKVLLYPILIIQKLSFGVDLNRLSDLKIAGDYLFKDGVMTLRRSELGSSAAQVSAVGTINLPSELLDLIVTAQVGNIKPVDVAVGGTVAKPTTKVKYGKFIGDIFRAVSDEATPQSP
ncbi:MAG: AsmA-like C-terminal region-containing protein, partial [Elusimicrobia bacterium]|nr:AsmA-like C-terminal region-containing protein [Elusimicrobiota bacterium]